MRVTIDVPDELDLDSICGVMRHVEGEYMDGTSLDLANTGDRVAEATGLVWAIATAAQRVSDRRLLEAICRRVVLEHNDDADEEALWEITNDWQAVITTEHTRACVSLLKNGQIEIEFAYGNRVHKAGNITVMYVESQSDEAIEIFDLAAVGSTIADQLA